MTSEFLRESALATRMRASFSRMLWPSIWLALASMITTSCAAFGVDSPRSPLPCFSAASTEGTPTCDYRVVEVYPHDRGAFTQGLVYEDGSLYEGTGLRGQSSLRKVELETGSILQIDYVLGRFTDEQIEEQIAAFGAGN